MSAFDGFPSTIRIGPYDIEVKIVEKIKCDDGSESWGEFDLETYVVTFAANQAGPMHAVDTALHEIGHVVWKVNAFNRTAGEERVCATFATAILQIVRDNPGLVKWIAKNISKPIGEG